MVEHIKTFFTALLGVSLPEVCYILFALALAYFILRAFFTVFHWNPRILDYTFFVTVAFLALSSLGGMTWNFSLS